MSVFSPDVAITNTPLPVDTSGQTINVGNFPGTQAVSGTVNVGNFPATQNVSGSVTVSGTVSTIQGATTAATVTNVSVGTSAVTLSSSNANKTKVIIYNETGTLYVKLGTGASSSSYSMQLASKAVWELSGYAGVITAIKASGTTPVLVTEIGI